MEFIYFKTLLPSKDDYGTNNSPNIENANFCHILKQNKNRNYFNNTSAIVFNNKKTDFSDYFGNDLKTIIISAKNHIFTNYIQLNKQAEY